MNRRASHRFERGFPAPVCGVDEAGRGPLAGPVVAAAIVFAGDRLPRGIDDSKALTAAERERLYERIMAAALVGVGQASVTEIDQINILQATMLAMRRAVSALACVPAHVLVDGNRAPGLGLPTTAVIDGDALCLSIAAASVVAKVVRDRQMVELDRHYPGYGFARHKGYGTPEHLDALRRLGPCALHRRSFAPVRQGALDFAPVAADDEADEVAAAAG